MGNYPRCSGPIRVMVVDDSPIARRLIELVLGRSEHAEVVSQQSDGRDVVADLGEHAVDVLILDLEMPEMNGLAVLTGIAKLKKRVGVIIYSGAEKEVARRAEALLQGRMPSRVMNKGEGVGGGVEGLKKWLVPTVQELGEEVRRGRTTAPGSSASTLSQADTQPRPMADAASAPLPAPIKQGFPLASFASSRARLLVLGASTGGPDALLTMLQDLPTDIGVPMALVQHMPVGFTEQLAARLDAKCAIKVREATDGERLGAGCLLIAPGGKHLEIQRSGTHLLARLTESPPENSCRPAVDVLFRTAAKAVPSSLLGVVLTGMGQDGMLGAQDIRSTGGTVIVQDEASSVVWGMPGAVAKAGHADLVLPLGEIADEVTTRVMPKGTLDQTRDAG